MDLFKHIRNHVIAQVEALASEGAIKGENLPLHAISVDPPRDASHGDMATNAAMVLAKPAQMNPRAIADLLVPRLAALPEVKAASIAGPGFINLRFSNDFWLRTITDIFDEGIGYGNSDVGAGIQVNVEYVSANPTGPMHVGHARGAVFGDALALLLIKAGYDVTREYYINDAGAQVDVLGRSAFMRYREALGENIGAIPEGLYPGEYLKSVGEGLAQKYGRLYLDRPESEWLSVCRDFAIEAMLVMIKDDLAALGIYHDVFASERSIVQSGKIEEAINVLSGKGLVYTGVLEPPKGKKPEDWESRPQMLFKSSEFGDDIDRPLRKSDGSWTYFAPDIAYHYDKYLRGHTVLVNVWGADHGGYVKRMQAAVNALTGGKAELDVKLCQMVNLMEDGVPVKMSKRAGTFVTLREVVDEVGKGVVRFIMLTRKNDAPLEFDLKKVTEQSKDNPVFYVQYAHARTRSVLRNTTAEMPDAVKALGQLTTEQLTLLSHPAELALIRRLATWPRTIESAAQAHEPHRLAFYLQELAAEFHALWNLGKENVDIRFIVQDNLPLTVARLALIRAVSL
ncbi:MAG: arginine--tRNA ligase, partial [Alphaproteobacteria bacterium]|nr:arginine--tRNA ligase [Alphaproteobacteria bacterium]